MSVWSRIGGIGLAAAGVMTGNPGLVAAGAGVFSAGEASSANKKASEQQVSAVDEAKAVNTAVDQRTQASYQPYTYLGSQAASTLGSMMGFQPMPMPSGGGTAPGALPAGMQQQAGMRQPPGATLGDLATGDTGRTAMARPAPETPQVRAQLSTQSGYQPQGGTLGGMMPAMVMLRAPTGETRAVPADQAPALLARGAQRVA